MVSTDHAASVPLEMDRAPSSVLAEVAEVVEEIAETVSDRGFTHEVTFSDDFGRPPRIKLSILMAAYNEERTIVKAVKSILSVNFPCEVELIVVDDGSMDATSDLLKMIDDPRMISHRHAKNSGKGASLLTAAALATGTHMVPFDADLEYAAEDIANMVVPVINGRCDVVYGARLFGVNTVYQSYRYAMGNKLMTQLANILYDSYLSDMHTCLKLMPLEVFQGLNLSEMGFGLDTQVTALLLRSGVRPFEVPISYHSRSHAQGKKISWRDAVKCIWILLRTRVSSRDRAAASIPVKSVA
jgi:glycosyltransferase involved in cell wall biosynthesis